MLPDAPLPALLAELASPTEAPGGGSALALAAAAAAAVVGMAARLSSPAWADAAGAAAQADALRERALTLVRVDAEAYQQALDARAAASGLPAGQTDSVLGRAFEQAAEPLLALARLAADVAELAGTVATQGAPRVQADAAAAAALAHAAVRGAHELIAVNLTALPGDARVREAAMLADEAGRAFERARVVRG